MSNSIPKKRLLYLGGLLPSHVASVNPGLNPAGQLFETSLLNELRQHLDLSIASTIPVRVEATGMPDLCVLERSPEFWYRFKALLALRSFLMDLEPDALLVYNLTPIYVHLCAWVRRHFPDCKLILLFADSSTLGTRLKPFRRFRKRLKPYSFNEEKALKLFDGCIGLSANSEKWFPHVPWMWMPGGCTIDPLEPAAPMSGPLTFGYFGSLGAHAGIVQATEAFLKCNLEARLKICGHGRFDSGLQAKANQDPRIQFLGLLPTQSDCIRFAQTCDVLINPRPCGWGNENNFPSKLFQYAAAGRAILTTDLSGVRGVLGDAAFYFDPVNFEKNLTLALLTVSQHSREDLNARGTSIREKVQREFSWSVQAERIAAFVQKILEKP